MELLILILVLVGKNYFKHGGIMERIIKEGKEVTVEQVLKDGEKEHVQDSITFTRESLSYKKAELRKRMALLERVEAKFNE